MNWKIYEWIGVQFFLKIYEWIGRYTNELWFRFFLSGKYTNELEHIRMNWGLDFFFRIIHIHFIFKIGGLLWCSKKLVTGYNFSYTKSYEKLWSEANIEYFVTFLEFRKIEKNTCFYCIENNIFSNYSGWDASKLCFLKNARFSPLPWLRECATGF